MVSEVIRTTQTRKDFQFCSAALTATSPPPPPFSSTPTRAWWCAGSTEQDFQTISLPFQRAHRCLTDVQTQARSTNGSCVATNCLAAAPLCGWMTVNPVSLPLFKGASPAVLFQLGSRRGRCVAAQLLQGILRGSTAACQAFKQQ